MLLATSLSIGALVLEYFSVTVSYRARSKTAASLVEKSCKCNITMNMIFHVDTLNLHVLHKPFYLLFIQSL